MQNIDSLKELLKEKKTKQEELYKCDEKQICLLSDLLNSFILQELKLKNQDIKIEELIKEVEKLSSEIQLLKKIILPREPQESPKSSGNPYPFISCLCGSKIKKSSLFNHVKTKKHLKFLDYNIN